MIIVILIMLFVIFIFLSYIFLTLSSEIEMLKKQAKILNQKNYDAIKENSDFIILQKNRFEARFVSIEIECADMKKELVMSLEHLKLKENLSIENQKLKKIIKRQSKHYPPR